MLRLGGRLLLRWGGGEEGDGGGEIGGARRLARKREEAEGVEGGGVEDLRVGVEEVDGGGEGGGEGTEGEVGGVLRVGLRRVKFI